MSIDLTSRRRMDTSKVLVEPPCINPSVLATQPPVAEGADDSPERDDGDVASTPVGPALGVAHPDSDKG